MHDSVWDGCCWGCAAPDSLDDSMRNVFPSACAVAGMRLTIPERRMTTPHIFLPYRTSGRPDVETAIRRAVLATVAYDAVRTP